MRLIYIKSGVCFLMLIGLVACDGGRRAEVSAWMNGVKKQVKPVPEDGSIVKKFVPEVYTQSEILDPYNSAKLSIAISKMQMQSGGAFKPNLQRPKEELEAYALESIRMVVVLRKKSLSYALLQVDKVVFSVKVGSYVGHDFGVVTKINEDSVELRESVQDAYGVWTERKTKIVLSQDEKK